MHAPRTPLVKEIGGNCHVSWSPLKSQPGFAVLGSKQGGGGFNDYGGDLKLVSLDMQNSGTTMPVMCEIKTPYVHAGVHASTAAAAAVCLLLPAPSPQLPVCLRSCGLFVGVVPVPASALLTGAPCRPTRDRGPWASWPEA